VRIRPVSTCVVLFSLVAMLMASQPAGANDSASPSDATNVDDGEEVLPVRASELYGDSGPITREQLPDWLRDRVRDEALELASSSHLEEARRTWVDTLDFVDQVDYQLEFRETFGLDTSAEHIGQVLNQRRQTEFGIQGFGLYLSEAESDDFASRETLAVALENFDDSTVGGPHNLVGILQAHQNHGKIHIHVVESKLVDRKALREQFGPGGFLIVQERRSLEELETIRATLTERLIEFDIAFASEIAFTDQGSAVRLFLPEGFKLTGSITHGVPNDSILVETGLEVSDVHEDNNHSRSDLAPGQTIHVNDHGAAGWCTWGANGHTNTYNYIVTAGHCFKNSVNTSATTRYERNNFMIKNGSRHLNTIYKELTPTSAFLYARNTSYIDAARISSADADTNAYHKMGEFGHIVNRARHNSWDVGTFLCAALGRSRTFRCGVVQSENYTYNDPNGPFNTTRGVRLSFTVDSGDSGAGVVGVVGGYPTVGDGLTLDGIIKAKITVSGWFDRSLMVTAYDVKRGLGSSFDFNCANSLQTKAADQWGFCPAVFR